MFHKIYISDFQQIQQYFNLQSHQIDYSISMNNIVKSQNILILYGLCIYLHHDISQHQYIQIQNNALKFPQQDRQKTIYYMNRTIAKKIQWITQDEQAKVMLQFLREQNKCYDIKMILKYQLDIDLTNNPSNKTGCYVIYYFYSEENQAMVNNFVIKKIPISDQIYKRKLQFIGLINNKQNYIHNYGYIQQKKTNCKIIQISDNPITLHINQSSLSHITQNSILINNSISGINMKFEIFIIYGIAIYVQQFINKLQQDIKQIQYNTYAIDDKFYNSIIFRKYRKIAQRYKKCKIFNINDGEQIQIYYHVSISNLFNQLYTKYGEYKTVRLNTVKYAMKDKYVMDMEQEMPDFFIESDKLQGDMLTANKQFVQFLQSRNQKYKQQRKIQKKQKKQAQIIQSNSKKPNQTPIINKQPITIQFSNNLQICQQNLQQFMQTCTIFKMQQQMNYKIDVGQYIRIVNRVKKNSTVYIIFQNYVQLIHLQSVIEEQISIQQLGRIIKQYQQQIFHKPKQIHSVNKQLLINLYPCPQQSWQNSSQYLYSIISQIKSDNSTNFRTIICNIKILKQILNTIIINFHLIFVLQQQIPFIQCDNIFYKQTQQTRLKINKLTNQYYCHVKVDVINKDFRDSMNFKKDQALLRDIMSVNIHQYQIGDYILSQVDQYNISYMIAEGLTSMFLILSKRPTQEFVYFTYHQKLVKIIRDKNGNFQKFQQAFMRDINRTAQPMIRPAIQRAFLTGQKFLAINLPLQHVKAVNLTNITRLSIGNHNLVRYYLRRISSSERYKICIRHPCTLEYFKKKFAKNYTLRFDNQKLRKQIKQLDLGYGNIEKWRQKPFVCLKANHFICEKLLKKFQQFYVKQAKK